MTHGVVRRGVRTGRKRKCMLEGNATLRTSWIGGKLADSYLGTKLSVKAVRGIKLDHVQKGGYLHGRGSFK